MRRFSLFLAPLFLVLCVFEWQLYRTGESRPIRVLVRRFAGFADPPLLQRRFFSQQYNLYHIEMMQQRRPRIVAIGSSRIGALRSRMFPPLGGSFYAAPHLIYCAEDIRGYAELIRTGFLPRPDVVIIGLDPWNFSAHREREPWIQPDVKDDVFSAAAHISVLRTYVAGLLSGSTGIGEAPAEHYAVSQEGSTVDEPIRPFTFTDYVDREDPPIVTRMDRGEKQFAGFVDLDAEKVQIVFRAISTLRQAGVEVAVIEPPFATDVVRFLEANAERFPWWRRYRDEIPAALQKGGVPCVRASTPSDYGLSDAKHMYDGFHAGSYFMTCVLETLLQKAPAGSLLASFPVEHLRRLRDPPYTGTLPDSVPPAAGKPPY